MTEKERKAIEFIFEWGGIDGGHHKQWTLDQVARILAGEDYERFVDSFKNGDDGPDTYEWDEGIAP